MSKERRVGEPKPSKCGQFTARAVKIGNTLLGSVRTPKRKPGETPIGTFWMTDRVAWPSENGSVICLTRAYIAGMATYGVQRLGLETPDGSTYQISYQTVLDAMKAPMATPSKWVTVDVSLFEVEQPPEEERVANIIGKMRIGRRARQSSVTAAGY